MGDGLCPKSVHSVSLSSPVASEWTVVLGRLNQNGSNPFEVTLNVTNITLSNLTGSNVAVLLLSAQPILTDYIQPICRDNGQTFAVGSTCWAAGWSSGRGGGESMTQCDRQTNSLHYFTSLDQTCRHCHLCLTERFHIILSSSRGTSSAGVPDLSGKLWERVIE